MLSELTEMGMDDNILHKRKDQLFFGHPMGPFHCGMRTFFACESIGNYSEGGEGDGLSLLLKDGLESGRDDENKDNKRTISCLMRSIVRQGFECHDCLNEREETILVTVACSLRQSLLVCMSLQCFLLKNEETSFWTTETVRFFS
jgi:hypothetical protein